MRAGWWWIDRWRKSTAYTDMSLAEQGAYRNLLDELWLREGVLPKGDRALGRISGDALEWPVVRDAVMARFIATPGGYRNETHDEVMGQSLKRAKRQKRYRDKQRNADRNVTHNKPPNVGSSPSPSPSKSLSPSPEPRKTVSKAPLSQVGQPTISLDDDAPPGFIRWWTLYPNKVGKTKGLVYWMGQRPLASGKKRKLEPHTDQLVEALSRQIETRGAIRKADPGAFIAEWKHGDSYLYNGGWLDEVTADTVAPSLQSKIPPGHPASGRKSDEKWRENGFEYHLADFGNRLELRKRSSPNDAWMEVETWRG